MGKKVNLPLFPEPVAEKKPARAEKRPSVDAARARLGGRVTEVDGPPGGFAPGVIVTFAGTGGRPASGVVVFASQTEVHVLLDGIRLRRLEPDEVALHEGEPGFELEKIAGDARLFGALVEGQSVRYGGSDGGLIDGKVVEKCRWGALVLRDDGAVVAVGFRKLWPSSGGSGDA